MQSLEGHRPGRGGKVLVHTRRHVGHGPSGKMDKMRKDRDLTEARLFFLYATGVDDRTDSQILDADVVQHRSSEAKLHPG